MRAYVVFTKPGKYNWSRHVTEYHYGGGVFGVDINRAALYRCREDAKMEAVDCASSRMDSRPMRPIFAVKEIEI